MLAAEGTAILPQIDGFNTILSTHPLLHDRSNLLSDAGAKCASYLEDASAGAFMRSGVFDSVLLTLSDMHHSHQVRPCAGT